MTNNSLVSLYVNAALWAVSICQKFVFQLSFLTRKKFNNRDINMNRKRLYVFIWMFGHQTCQPIFNLALNMCNKYCLCIHFLLNSSLHGESHNLVNIFAISPSFSLLGPSLGEIRSIKHDSWFMF